MLWSHAAALRCRQGLRIACRGFAQGTSALYLRLNVDLDAQLQKFEQYALKTCLHQPAGLILAVRAGSRDELSSRCSDL